MQTITKVALDAMGGDNAPAEIVKGAVDAVSSREDIKVFLVGQEDVVREELQKYPYPQERIEVVDAPEVIEMAEPPVQAIRKKKQSSLVVGMNMVKQREADAFVSAGSSGAVLVGGQTIVGRIRGIKRPPLAPIIPTETGISLLIDCGANVDARPEHLLQFAKMGSIYMENVVGIKNPRVAIVNIGAEEEKGVEIRIAGVVRRSLERMRRVPGPKGPDRRRGGGASVRYGGSGFDVRSGKCVPPHVAARGGRIGIFHRSGFAGTCRVEGFCRNSRTELRPGVQSLEIRFSRCRRRNGPSEAIGGGGLRPAGGRSADDAAGGGRAAPCFFRKDAFFRIFEYLCRR